MSDLKKDGFGFVTAAKMTPFGRKALKMTRYLFYLDAVHDHSLWQYMTDDVIFISPITNDTAYSCEAYKESIKEDFIFWFDLFEEKYRLVYATEKVALVTGSYLLQYREEEQLFFMVRQRFSMFYVNVNGEPVLKHAHVSDPDSYKDSNDFSFNAGDELRSFINRLKFRATHDQMTGLFNRNYLEENYDKLNGALHENEKGLVMVFDLNNFKEVNDRFGHDEGDRILKLFGKCLSEVLQELLPNAIICHFGGDEFIFVDPAGDLKDVGEICRAVRDEFCPQLDHVRGIISFSAGFALVKPKISLNEMLSIADRRMYRCKKRLKRILELTGRRY